MLNWLLLLPGVRKVPELLQAYFFPTARLGEDRSLSKETLVQRQVWPLGFLSSNSFLL